MGVEDDLHGDLRSRIMYSTRRDSRVSFGVPRLVRVIGNSDFVEGPSAYLKSLGSIASLSPSPTRL